MQEFLINSICLFIQLLIIQKTCVQPVKQKTCHQKTFLKRSCLRHFYLFPLFFLRHLSGKQAFKVIVLSVLPVQLITGKKAPCDLIPAEILSDQILRDLHAQFLVGFQNLRQILPASCCHEELSVHRVLHRIKMIFFHAKISQDRSVNLLFPGILHPHIKICLDIHPPHTVQGYDIKLPDRLIIFRRISRCRDQPSFRHAVASEHLVL